MFRPSRSSTADTGPLLAWKVRSFAIGAALALAGMGLDVGWLVWSGIGVLAIGLLLRFLPSRGDS